MSNDAPKIFLMDQKTPFSHECERTVTKLDNEIIEAIKKAKDAGVPRGLLVSILFVHATRESINVIGAE